jgi:hypothetical protein
MPCGDMIHNLTALHFAGLISFSRERGVEAIPSMNSGSMPPNNRSILAQLALDQGADALLLIDSDMQFPPASLLGLLTRGDLDIIGATYAQRNPGGAIHGHELDGSSIDCGVGDDIREVRELPAGFLLIRRRVLEAIVTAGDKPFFRFPFAPGAESSGSEDYDFCRRARNLGFKVWLEPRLSRALGHVGTAIYRIPAPATLVDLAA